MVILNYQCKQFTNNLETMLAFRLHFLYIQKLREKIIRNKQRKLYYYSEFSIKEKVFKSKRNALI